MIFKRWRGPRAARPDAPPAGAEPVSPLAVPGYGPPPATRAYDGGPEPANYGIPPEAQPINDPADPAEPVDQPVDDQAEAPVDRPVDQPAADDPPAAT
jgi:hypothetical protein